ncbi:hypothetical protein RCL1_007701 [Eukaryota sp. TZLM3-RCL]
MLNHVKTTDISFLSSCITLKSLSLDKCNVDDFSILSALKKLQFISLNNIKMNDLAPLACLYELQNISLRSTQVSDLWPLKDLYKLTYLDVRETLLPVQHQRELTYKNEVRTLVFCCQKSSGNVIVGKHYVQQELEKERAVAIQRQEELEKRQEELEERLKRKQKRKSNASLQAISTPIQVNIDPKYARFSAQTKGSSLTLSNNGTVVTSSGNGSNRDKFVTIEHSSSVKRMSFTLLKKHDGYYIGTYLGFSDTSSGDVNYGVYLDSCYCRIHGSNKDKLGPCLQVNDSIIVDLTENQATFSHSNGFWSFTINISRNLVFGINPQSAVSWSIQAL